MRFLLLLALLTSMACSDERAAPPSPPRPPVLLSYLYPEVPYARRVDGAVVSYDEYFAVSLDAMPNARSVSWTRDGGLLFGHGATVVVDQAGVVWTWGGNEYGELGYETTMTCGGDGGWFSSSYRCAEVPAAVEALGRFREASGTCGILESGELECWGGRDASRQLLPPRIVPLPSPPVHVRQPYVVLADGTVWDGKGIVSGLPPIADISSVSSYAPVCALARDGTVSCWGYASSGERGDEDLGTNMTTTPAPIHSPFRFTSISAGLGVACGLLEAVPGRLACWGCGRHPEDCPQNLVPRIVPDLGQVLQVRAFLDTIYALESDGTLVALSWPNTSKRQVVR